MSLVAQMAPDFTANAVTPENLIEPFTLSSLRGKYVVLFFYPMDFTFVCPTELVAFDNAIEKFKALNAELVSVSVDSEYSHYAWKQIERSKGAFSASMSTTPGCWIPTPCCSISRNSVSAGFPTNRCAPKAGTAARSLRLCLLKRKALPRPSRSGRAARCCWGTPNSSPRTAT